MNPAGAARQGDHDAARDAGAAVSLLCLRWREHSLATGWAVRWDWWIPAVDTVARAACAGLDLVQPCGVLAAARARVGVGAGETLDDIVALHTALGVSRPELPVVRAVAEGWAESASAAVTEVIDPVCTDPLTGLTTLAYLRTRIGELYQAAEPPGHALVLVELVDGEHAGDDAAGRAGRGWRRLVRVIVVGRVLRAVFSGGETLTLLGMCRLTVLVADRPGLDGRVATLRMALRDRHPARVWVTRLPARADQAIRLLTELADGSPAP